MTDIDTLASLLAETGMEEDVSDIDAVQAYRTALRSTYVSRDGDECGRTYNLVDEAAADAAIAELQDKLDRAQEYARIEVKRKGEAVERECAAIERAEKAEADYRKALADNGVLKDRLDAAEAELGELDSYNGHLKWMDEHYPLDVSYFAEGESVGCQVMRMSRKVMESEAALAVCEQQKRGLATAAKTGVVAANRVIELEAEVEKLRNLLGYADTGGWFYSYDEERAKRIELESEVKRLKEQLDKLDEAYGEMLSGNGVLKDKLAEAEYAAKENRAAMDNAIKAWREAEAQLDRIDPSRLVDRGEV